MCEKCKLLWNKDPLSLRKRTYWHESSTSSDFKNMMCRQCYGIVFDMHKRAQKSSAGFYAKKISSEDTACGKLADISNDAVNELRLRHEDETFKRLRWCLDNSMTPAHDYVHLAPGDDMMFMVSFC